MGLPFLETLAQGLLDEAGGDPVTLANSVVLLPTRRACRALRDTFLRLNAGAPMLLPTLSPLGDLDADEIIIANDAPRSDPDTLDLPDAIGALRRQVLLTRAILAAGDAFAESTEHAAALAIELGRFLDLVLTERGTFDGLETLVPDDHAQHWQEVLKFLHIITGVWPSILATDGSIDAVDRRNRVLNARSDLWNRHQPDQRIVAAGSTGSIPATATLLTVIADLPNGTVVLPGLDQSMDAESWAALSPDHAQYGLKSLLGRLHIDRDDVGLWPSVGRSRQPDRDAIAARTALIADALRPAETTDAWRHRSKSSSLGMDGLHRVDCETPEEEATVIALVLRQALETPGRTAALVTTDRVLARRVSTMLRRWSVDIDDSAGIPLLDTPVGSFLMLVAEMVANTLAPIPLLAALKHPLTGLGLPAATARRLTRLLEMTLLRGPRPAPGIDGLRAAVSAEPRNQDALTRLVERLATIATPVADLMMAPSPVAAIDLIQAHITVAEDLASTKESFGRERLWVKDDGTAAAAFLEELLEAGADLPPISASGYGRLFRALAAGRVVRATHGLHPRLAIWSPLEARLQHTDVMILGGLNEGQWPGEPPVDPWLSRPMRHAFGLSAPERRIGLSAHDFQALTGAPTVIMTRAGRVDGTPTVPSRWLQRLDAVLDTTGHREILTTQAGQWRHWASLLDHTAVFRPIERPAPRPDPAVRPRSLSVTQIETWRRNPYAIYAREILNLRPLDPIDQSPDGSDRGQILHDVLDIFVRQHPVSLPSNAIDQLVGLGSVAFRSIEPFPDLYAFWWGRFQRIAHWFIAEERRRRDDGHLPIATEVSGACHLPDPRGTDFTLRAKADRIDQDRGGAYLIIDYKTGQVPKDKDVASGFAPQLPLEALILAEGGFAEIPPGPVAGLAYLRLTGREPPGDLTVLKDDPIASVEHARAGLLKLISHYADGATGYVSHPWPDQAPRYDDYAHLSRVLEWNVSDESTGE